MGKTSKELQNKIGPFDKAKNKIRRMYFERTGSWFYPEERAEGYKITEIQRIKSKYLGTKLGKS